MYATRPQRCNVVLHGCVFPHLGVHRRTNYDRRNRGNERRGEKVVGHACCVSGNHPRSGGGNDDEVGLLTEPRVRDDILVVPQRSVNRFRRQRAESGLTDETFGIGRHDRRNVRTGVDELSTNFDRFVGSDAAGNTDDYEATRKLTRREHDGTAQAETYSAESSEATSPDSASTASSALAAAAQSVRYELPSTAS